MSTIEEPQPARPWRPGEGPQPQVWTWPNGEEPALYVWTAGKWRYARVLARQNWADGSVRYQVAVPLEGTTSVMTRTYQWPQPGLRATHGSRREPWDGRRAPAGGTPRVRPHQAHQAQAGPHGAFGYR